MTKQKKYFWLFLSTLLVIIIIASCITENNSSKNNLTKEMVEDYLSLQSDWDSMSPAEKKVFCVRDYQENTVNWFFVKDMC